MIKDNKSKFGVLETYDKLYYVIYDKPPFTSISKAMSLAIQLNKQPKGSPIKRAKGRFDKI